MPKRRDEEDQQWGEDSDIYLPDESLKSAFYDPKAHIVYRNGAIVVENEHERATEEPVELSHDYTIAKIYTILQDWARQQAVPLMDKRGATSADFERFLERFL